jgi:PAS domain S-box-containing protein
MPLTRQLGVGLVLFNLIVMAMAGLWLSRAFDADEERAAVSSRNIATVLAQSITSTFQRTDMALTSAVDQMARHHADLNEMEATLGDLRARLPDIDSLGYGDAEGNVRLFIPQPFANRMNIEDREYFHILRDDPTAQLVVSRPVRGKSTGTWQIILARRLNAGDGSFAGVVYAVIRLNRLATMLSQIDIGPGGVIAIRDDDFGLVARTPELDTPDHSVGDKTVSDAFKAVVATDPSGATYTAMVSTDNIRRTLSYRRAFDRYYVIVGLATEDYLAGWKTDVLRVAGVLVLFAALSLILYRIIIRSWRQNQALLAETRAAKAKIEDLSELNRAVISASTTGVLAYRGDGSCILANEAAPDIIGGTVAELLAQNFGNLESWCRSGKLELAETVLSTGIPGRKVVNCRSSFGKDFAIDADLSRFFLGGKPHLLMMCRDVTVQKRAEEMLAASEARYRGLVETQSDWVIRVDHDGRFVFVNDAFSKAFGRSSQDMIGQPWRPCVHPDDVETTLKAMTKATTGPDYRATVESRQMLPDGIRWVAWEGCGLRDASGAIREIQAVGRDITDWVEHRDRLRALVRELDVSNKELEQFAYVASHDLREPLRMVTSYVDLLARRYGDVLDDDGKEFIGFARDGAKRMENLILDLLEYSRIGRSGKAKTLVDLGQAVAEAVAILGIAITDAGGQVEVGAGFPQILGHRDDLIRLFQNLIGNALKYRSAERAPLVKVSAARDGAATVIKVEDNGIGIAPEYFERIFGVFQRLHGRGDYEGTGIGLANCKKIVDQHDGRIWVESVPDQGSCFFISFPA